MGYILGDYYEIKSVKYGNVINLSGNHSGICIPNGNPITLFGRTGDVDQKWAAFAYENAAKICSKRNPGYILNYNTLDASCIAWPISTAALEDTEIDYMTVNSEKNLYRLRLSRRELYLTATGATSKLYWQPAANDDSQLFEILHEESPPEPPIPPADIDSPLVTKFIVAYTGNYTQNRAAQGSSISEITIHHCASVMSIDALGKLWQTVGREGSAHYGVSEDEIGQYVRECDVAWCNGGSNSPHGWEANCRAVTIEASNNGGVPNWTVSDKTLLTLTKLVADIAKRNDLGKLVNGANLTWHSMYATTICPGPYLSGKLQQVVDDANQINGFV